MDSASCLCIVLKTIVMMLWPLLVLLFASLKFAVGDTIHCNETLKCPYLMTRMSSHGMTVYSGNLFNVSASVYDCCNVSYEWKYDLQACIISGPASFDIDMYQQCTTTTYDQYPYYKNYTYSHHITLYYNTTSINVTDSSEVILLIQTQWPIIKTLQSNMSVMLKQHEPICYNCCIDSRNEVSDLTLSINHLYVQCDNQTSIASFVVFFLIQPLPLTVVVLIIIVFNIQMTNGYMIGFVFYCQMISIVYPNLSLNFAIETKFKYCQDCLLYYPNLYSGLFNLNFLTFLPKLLCITSNMTPLQAIPLCYIIPTYPLVLLLLIYTWITMYDKGFRCVVTITIPLHRLLARFWRKINIKPSLIHSIASIYLLCFTQFASTSLQLLYATKCNDCNNTYENNSTRIMFYKNKFFGWPHILAGIFAIIALVFIIFLPMLYIQLYPFKVFHKLLSCLHLRKKILISLGDVFTEPYKDGSKNTRDYRYFSGFYLFLRIIVLCLYFIPKYENNTSDDISSTPKYADIILYSQMTLFTAFGCTIMIFRPYKQNVHSFLDLLFMLFLATLNTVTITSRYGCAAKTMNFTFLVIIFGVIVLGYFPYLIMKKNWIYFRGLKCYRKRNTPNEEHIDMEFILVDDDNWDADRMEHPDNYDEHHVKYVPYDLIVFKENTVHNKARSAEINNIETDQLSESDARLIPGSSNTIPLHSIVNTTQESSISDVNDEDEV